MFYDADQYYKDELRAAGALLTGHFAFKSEVDGKKMHGTEYIYKPAILWSTRLTSFLAGEIARHFRTHGVSVVLGPEKSGALFARHVAQHLHNAEDISVASVEEVAPGTFRVPEQFGCQLRGKRVGLTEDVINYGHTLRLSIEAVNYWGGDVVAIGAIANRMSLPWHAFQIPKDSLYSVTNFGMESWPEEHCEHCARCPLDDPHQKYTEQLSKLPEIRQRIRAKFEARASC